MKRLAKTVLLVSFAIVFGGLSFWAVRPSAVWISDEKDALCVLKLPEGEASASATFTTSGPIERFFVAARPGARNEQLALSITGGEGLLVRVAINRSTRFTCGHSVQILPATYTAVLSQETGTHGGLVVVSDHQDEVGITGWQIWSRVLLGLVLFSGIWAWVARRSRNLRHRAVSSLVFQRLLLAFVLIFLYLLFHEGGHSLGQIAFGRFDLTRSDFWGIHGSPHSGGKPGPVLEPWQQAVISGGGPMFPNLVGWALFLIWLSPIGKRIRIGRPVINMYFSAIVAMSVFPFVAVAGCLLGIISDGDWEGFIGNVPGPLWLVKTLLWAVLLVNAVILWRVIPELIRSWKAQNARIRNVPGASEVVGFVKTDAAV